MPVATVYWEQVSTACGKKRQPWRLWQNRGRERERPALRPRLEQRAGAATAMGEKRTPGYWVSVGQSGG